LYSYRASLPRAVAAICLASAPCPILHPLPSRSTKSR
jgi:hypothetical protein